MRSLSLQPWAIIGAGLWWLPAVGMAQAPLPPPAVPPGATAPAPGGLDDIAAAKALLNPKPSAEAEPEELAGLPKRHHAERLDWGRAYRLALVRSKAKEEDATPAETLDPKAIEDAAKRLGVDGFEAFRKAFLDDPKFRDPSAAIFDLLARQQRYENARQRLDSLRRLLAVLMELQQGESSGQTQLQVDRVDDAVQDARLRLVEVRDGYREAFDRLKLELGLSPHAAVLADPAPGSGFRAGFDALRHWSARPRRTFDELPAIVARMPALTDVSAGGTSVTAMAAAPEEIEPALQSWTEAARKVRGSALDAEAERKLRHDLRRLVEANIRYQTLKRKLVLLVRLRDQAQEQLIAPPQPSGTSSAQAADRVTAILAIEDDLRRAEDAIVGHWATYQTLRLSLARDLGTLPAASWDEFFETLSARPAPLPAGN